MHVTCESFHPQENIGQDIKGQLFQRPTDAVSKKMGISETPSSSSSKLRLGEIDKGNDGLQLAENPKEPESKASMKAAETPKYFQSKNVRLLYRRIWRANQANLGVIWVAHVNCSDTIS